MKLIGQEEVWENIKRGRDPARLGLVPGRAGRADGARHLNPGSVHGAARQLGDHGPRRRHPRPRQGGERLRQLRRRLHRLGLGHSPQPAPDHRRGRRPRRHALHPKAAGAFKTIIRDPIRFVRTLVSAGDARLPPVRQPNFLTHLRAALVGWLTGAMAGAGIYIPQGFSLREILKFVLSVLGLTWANIRGKLVRADQRDRRPRAGDRLRHRPHPGHRRAGRRLGADR